LDHVVILVSDVQDISTWPRDDRQSRAVEKVVSELRIRTCEDLVDEGFIYGEGYMVRSRSESDDRVEASAWLKDEGLSVGSQMKCQGGGHISRKGHGLAFVG